MKKITRLFLPLLVMVLSAGTCTATQYSFDFYFKGKRQNIKINLNDTSVTYYKNKTHQWPFEISGYAAFGKEDKGHIYLRSVMDQVRRNASASGYSEGDLAEYTIAFVQSLNYYSERNEFVRYPIETIADRGGDCEDTALLIVALLNQLGYDSQLVMLPGHMMASVACEECEGSSVTSNGKRYILIESTSPTKIGYMDPRYSNTSCKLAAIPNSNGSLAFHDDPNDSTTPAIDPVITPNIEEPEYAYIPGDENGQLLVFDNEADFLKAWNELVNQMTVTPETTVTPQMSPDPQTNFTPQFAIPQMNIPQMNIPQISIPQMTIPQMTITPPDLSEVFKMNGVTIIFGNQ